MAEGGVFYMQKKDKLPEPEVRILSAKVDDLVSDMVGPQPVQLGGFKISISVGIQLFGNR